uniref:Uncharacterized protein n=1 Tax=Phenylobacterium glaciei TaxID=2803784 RepID=A0A974P158_9CAUL|nr:hypothetical protein JKL49_17505 [Phenylobacterium glaciei]
MSLAFDRVGGPLAPFTGALDVILAQQQANGAIPGSTRARGTPGTTPNA